METTIHNTTEFDEFLSRMLDPLALPRDHANQWDISALWENRAVLEDQLEPGRPEKGSTAAKGR